MPVVERREQLVVAGAARARRRTARRGARSRISARGAHQVGQDARAARCAGCPAAARRPGAPDRGRGRAGTTSRGSAAWSARAADGRPTCTGTPASRRSPPRTGRSPARDRRSRFIVFMPAAAPGPELRADVVDDRHAALAAARGASEEVEVGKIDRRRRRRAASASAAATRRAVGRLGARQHAQRLGQAGDREAAEVADSEAPAARSRSPPKPVMTASGSSAQDLGRERAGVRSPDGSPHEIITRRRCGPRD